MGGEDRLFTLAEAAKETGYTQRRLRQLAEDGTLDATLYGRTYLVKESVLARFKETHRPSTGRPRGSKNRRPLSRCAESPAEYRTD